MSKENVLNRLAVIVYFISIVSFFVEIRLAVNTWDYHSRVLGGGLGGLLPLFSWIFLLSAHWVAMGAIVSLHMILVKRQKSVTIGILGTGLLVSIIFIIYTFPSIATFPSITGLITLIIFLFVFGFASGSGIASLAIFMFDTLMRIGKWATSKIE